MKVLLFSLMILNTVIAQASDASSAIIAAEQSRRAALLSNDIAALDKLLSDDLRYVHSTGKREDKRAVLEGLSSKQIGYERFELSGLDVHSITKDVAVLTGTIDQRKLGNGKWSDAKLLFHAVWRDEGGQWRLVSLQTVMPPVAKP